ncbi:MAG TPA: hypothetical protein VK762_37185 [Polyangiaceae bacterium]|nr:hypothetical protein [Polyangiaceae bacterium]
MTTPDTDELNSIRRQAALARTLLDELEEVAPGFDRGRALRAQVIEELTRLGCRIFEAAALLASEAKEDEEEARVAAERRDEPRAEPGVASVTRAW